jgi:hypothetical protein
MTELDQNAIEQHKYLWTTDKEDYVLLRVDDDENADLLVVNIARRHPEAKVFFDDRLSSAVKQRMLESGVRVVTYRELDDAFPRQHNKV